MPPAIMAKAVTAPERKPRAPNVAVIACAAAWTASGSALMPGKWPCEASVAVRRPNRSGGVEQVVAGFDGERHGGYVERGFAVGTGGARHGQPGARSAVREVIAGDHGPAVVERAHSRSQYLVCGCFGCSEVQVDVDAMGTDDLKFGEGAGCRVRDADPVQETGGSVQAGQVHAAPGPRFGFHSAWGEGPDPVGTEGQGAGQHQQSLVVHRDRHRVDLSLGALGCPCVEIRLVADGVAGELPVHIGGQ